MHLRYGMNPHQHPATATPIGSPPIGVVHGAPSYLNLLDALGGWQLVRDAGRAFGRPAAASFKHVSPAGAALAAPLDAVMTAIYGPASSPLATAYVRARDADPKSSFGDFVAVSEPVDADLADVLSRVVSDGIIAPGFAPGTVATLSRKKGGQFLILEADPAFEPPEVETREVFGLRLTQPRFTLPPADLGDDLRFGTIVAHYTQSNSVIYVRDGMVLGIGAGQQSRVDCTRLAGAKVDTWWSRRHPGLPPVTAPRIQDKITIQLAYADQLPPAERAEWLRELDGVSLVSDGAIPFTDNIEEARRHGVRFIAEPGGSIRSGDVAAACAEHGIGLTQTGIRLFHH
jgi:phosphoribosylaminoimidazolecarboxamide formyltransferase / IMP cyclohydrolase